MSFYFSKSGMIPAAKQKRQEAKNLETFRKLKGKQKLQFIWDYYKLPLAVLGIVLYVIFYNIYGQLHHRDAVLYTGLVNVASGEDLAGELSDHFLESQGMDIKHQKVGLYSGLYLTSETDDSNYQYAYASQMKILAAIDSEQLDVVLLNKAAFDAFSQNGYLYDLDKLLSQTDPSLHEMIEPDLVNNVSILEDNYMDVYFGDAEVYESETVEYAMGVALSHSPILQKAGFKETVYLGIIANTPRKETAVAYLRYLMEGE